MDTLMELLWANRRDKAKKRMTAAILPLELCRSRAFPCKYFPTLRGVETWQIKLNTKRFAGKKNVSMSGDVRLSNCWLRQAGETTLKNRFVFRFDWSGGKNSKLHKTLCARRWIFSNIVCCSEQFSVLLTSDSKFIEFHRSTAMSKVS